MLLYKYSIAYPPQKCNPVFAVRYPQNSIFSKRKNIFKKRYFRLDFYKIFHYNVIVTFAAMAQLVERVLGKDEVAGSNPASSSKMPYF